MTDNRAYLTSFVPTGSERWTVSGIGETNLTVAGQGDVALTATVNGRTLHGTMRGVICVPGLGTNLYSIGTTTDAGLKVVFSEDAVWFSRDEMVIMEGRRAGKKTLYRLNIQAKEQQPKVERAMTASQIEPVSLWHQRFGHLNHKTVLRMASLGSVTGLALINDKLHLSTHCSGCLMGKMSRNPFMSTRTRGTQVGGIIHSDVCGPIHICTPTGARYFVTFKNDHSEFCEIQLLKQKSEVPEAFKKFNAKKKNETGKGAKTLRSDGGGEFYSKEFEDLLAKAGIAHQVTPPYTPQLNGVAERTNRTVVESARSQMYWKKVPLELWELAIQCASYVQNMAISSTGKVTPFERWYGREPDVSHLRTFGSLAFAHVPDEKRKKLDPKATEGIMVGYGDSSRVYKIWDPVSRTIITSRDVVFEETLKFESPGVS